MATVEVRRAAAGDAGAVGALVTRFFAEEGFTTPPALVAERAARFVVHPANAAWLAWRDGTPMGVATVTTSFGLEYGLSAELEDLWVDPAARGSGIAGRLVDAAVAWCRRQGCGSVAVCVTAEGQAAHDLVGYYRRHGFTDDGRRLLGRDLA